MKQSEVKMNKKRRYYFEYHKVYYIFAVFEKIRNQNKNIY
ncbi:MAG: hypothetical protein H6Q19_1956 [Bacteroidetes bacterium]|nr:hypothetical protein [Bacteroidota bacterium]